MNAKRELLRVTRWNVHEVYIAGIRDDGMCQKSEHCQRCGQL
jgi:hypothetical protein